MMCFWLATWKALEASIVPVHMEASTSTIEASTSTIVQLQLHDFREYWLSNRARSRVYCIGYPIGFSCMIFESIGYPIGQEVGCIVLAIQ
jgi:hypothetical protein